MKSGWLFLAAALWTTLSLQACAEWIYDKDDDETSIGGNRFSMIDATEYTAWTYIDLDSQQATIVDEYAEGNTATAPEEWDFALHRFDCKTKGGAVLETPYSTIAQLVAAGSLPAGEFVADAMTDDRVAIDLSKMMQGIIVYAESDYNAELSKWMTVDLSRMPPTYTPSNKVYVIRMKDGSMAAVRFTDFIGPSQVKGYVSFDYVYPLEFQQTL